MLNQTLILACIMATAPALASCPTDNDLREGIVLVQNEPNFVRSDFDLEAGMLREVRVTRGGENDTATIRLFEHGLAPVLTSDADGERVFTYTPAPVKLDGLRAVGEMRFEVMEVDAFGKPIVAQTIFTFVDTARFDIMTCDYEVWKIRVTSAKLDATIETRDIDYAPALGLVMASRGDRGVNYRYSWIGTAADVAR